MKILEVCSYLYPAMTYGGPAKVVYDLSVELSKKHKVTVYTTDVWDEKRRIKNKEKLKERKGLKVIYFRNFINTLAFKIRFFTAFGMVFRYMRDKGKFDIAHIHDVFIIPQLLIGKLAHLFNKPYVISPHGVLDPVRTKDRSLLKQIVYKLLAKDVMNNASSLIATSDKEAKILEDLGYDKVRVVYNGVSIESIKAGKRFKKFKSNIFTLLYIGKIHHLKGLSFLLNALSKVDFDYQLLIAGPDDGGKEELEKIISNLNVKNIQFLGFVNEEDKAELFNIADLFAHPSLSEGFSISILEALKHGVPVLITRACNFPDVKKYNAGLVLSEDKLIPEIQSKLPKLVKNKKLLNKMGNNARRLIKERYSISAMCSEVKNIYSKAI